MGCWGDGWIELAQDRSQWRSLALEMLNFGFCYCCQFPDEKQRGISVKDNVNEVLSLHTMEVIFVWNECVIWLSHMLRGQHWTFPNDLIVLSWIPILEERTFNSTCNILIKALTPGIEDARNRLLFKVHIGINIFRNWQGVGGGGGFVWHNGQGCHLGSKYSDLPDLNRSTIELGTDLESPWKW